ncbi:MAG: hypothetical protein II966_00300 [Lachnospiraceae bacterium]|nr:hypothetical protein [Lachnospiraceae bacterium]
MDKKKIELLKTLEGEFKEADDIGEVSLFTKEELGAVDILRAEIAEFGTDLVSVLGEFFFLPFEEDEVLYFTSVITLSGSITEDIVPDLAGAVARLNYILPCGCFAIGDNDKNLIYRFSVPIFGDEDKKRQEMEMSNAANTAILIAEKYEGYLKLVMNDNMTVDEMIKTVQKGN